MNTAVNKDGILSGEEMQILQEIMNIAFGKSAADLAEVINTHVHLSVPYIEVMQVQCLPEYVRKQTKDHAQISIVEQKFWGRFRGDALLIFSAGAGKELISMLRQNDGKAGMSGPIDVLEIESIMEIGNILIGACVGKISELLRDVVTYTPPIVLIEKDGEKAVFSNNPDPDKAAVVLKTDFRFEEGGVSGYLFLVMDRGSMNWMKDALHAFIESYE